MPVSSLQFESILSTTLNEFKNKTGDDLLNNWLAKELESCDSVEAVLDIIQHQAEAFDKFRGGDKRLMKWIGSSVEVLYKISATLGAGVGMVRIHSQRPGVHFNIVVQVLPSANTVFTGIGVLLAVRSSVFLVIDPFNHNVYRQQRMSERATMRLSTSFSAFNSSSSALGFIPRSH